MADKLVPSVDDTGAVRRFVDMGDGTFAERVSVAGGAAGAGNAGYPAGAVPVAATSGNVANAQAQATLPAAAGKTTYVTSLQVSGAGSTSGGLSFFSLAGALGGTIPMTFQVQTGVSLENKAIVLNFSPPLPASAVNTALVLTVPALGAGNTNSIVSLQGFQL